MMTKIFNRAPAEISSGPAPGDPAMLGADKQPGPYHPDNPRFRKACIRERLTAIKAEREALLAERDAFG